MDKSKATSVELLGAKVIGVAKHSDSTNRFDFLHLTLADGRSAYVEAATIYAPEGTVLEVEVDDQV